ncbi:MAG: hypothetical protein RIR00_2003, partial [Pseudomonadota bacterium]
DMKLSLRQLEIFAAIARTENVSRAAARLSLSQSAASSALVELERQFDCPLFDRIGKSLRLNGVGRTLLPKADALLAQAGAIENLLAGGSLPPLALGATLTIGNYLAPALLAAYTRQHPGAGITLQVANTAAIVARLLRFDCDLALIEGETQHPDLLVSPWQQDELVIFSAPDHPLAQLVAAGPAELAGQDWILREPGSGTRAGFDRQVARHLSEVRVRLELEHTEAIKQAVAAGMGLGCLSRHALSDALTAGRLRAIPTPALSLTRPFYLVRHRQRPDNAAIRHFLALCGGEADTAAS